MNPTTVTAANLGKYPEHPRDGALVFSENGLLFFGGQTYRSVADAMSPRGDSNSLDARIATLEARADTFNVATSRALQDAAEAKGHAQAALTRVATAENAIDRLQDRVVVLEDGNDIPLFGDEDATPLVENVPRPRFSKDDRVVYIAPADFGGHSGVDVASRPDGTFGTVLEDSNGEPGVRVQWEGAARPTMTSVEFVQPVPPRTKFLVHDVVEIGQSIYGTVEPGTWGIVRSVIPAPDGGVVYSIKMPRRSFLFTESEIRGKVS